MKKLYLRNIKKGFATNSSSYHSTITRYIDIPEKIWVEFKEQGENDKFIKTFNGGYISGIVLKDDEDDVWVSYDKMYAASDEGIQVEDKGLKDGVNWVRITFDTMEEY